MKNLGLLIACVASAFIVSVALADTPGGASPKTETPPIQDEARDSGVPEPLTLFLGGTGLLAFGFAVRNGLFR